MEYLDTYSAMLKSIVDFWYNAYMFDLKIFSMKWMYIPAFIPIFFYLIFFMFKWSILLYPFWGPLSWIMRGVKSFPSSVASGIAKQVLKKED